MTDEPPTLPSPGDSPEAASPEALVGRIIEAADVEAWGDLSTALEAAREQPDPASSGGAPDVTAVERLRASLAAGRSASDALNDALGLLPAPWRFAEAVRVAHEDPSPRVLWTGGAGGGDMLRAGEVGVLGGAGGLGKSTIALDAAICADAAAQAGLHAAELGCGLRVAAGRALFAGYEDSAERLGERAEAIAEALAVGHTVARSPDTGDDLEQGYDEHLGGVLAGAARWSDGGPLYQPLEMPLFAPPAGQPNAPPAPTPTYRLLIARARSEGAHLLIIDPVSAAFSGNPNDAVSVRRFIAELTASARALGAAVLLLAHATKAGRRQQAELDAAQRGAEAIAGSGQWYDAARAVLLLEPELPRTPPPRGRNDDSLDADLATHRALEERRMATRRVLSLAKTNYGAGGWSRALGIRRTVVGEAGALGRFAGWAMSGDATVMEGGY